MVETFNLLENAAPVLAEYFRARERLEKAEAALATDGLVLLDRFKQPKPNPAASIARDSQAIMLRCVRALNLEAQGEQPRSLRRWSGGRKKRTEETPEQLRARHETALARLHGRTQ